MMFIRVNQLHWMIYEKARNVVCSYHAGHITERSSCRSSAGSTVFGCRWWSLRTPTLNPKFKDISHINLVLYKYSSYDYRVIFFMSKCVYIFLGHPVYIHVLVCNEINYRMLGVTIKIKKKSIKLSSPGLLKFPSGTLC